MTGLSNILIMSQSSIERRKMNVWKLLKNILKVNFAFIHQYDKFIEVISVYRGWAVSNIVRTYSPTPLSNRRQ